MKTELENLLMNLTPHTLKAISQDMYDVENWRSLSVNERVVFDKVRNTFKNLTGEDVKLIYNEAI